MAKNTKTAKKLREMPADDLTYELGEAKKDLYQMRIKSVTKELPNVMGIRSRRREIARLLTVLGEKKRASK